MTQSALRWLDTPLHKMVIVLTIAAAFVIALRVNPSLFLTFEQVTERASDVPRRLLAMVLLLKIVQTIASTLSWRNVLRAAFPDQPITFKRVFTIEQGKDAANLVLPVKAGMWGMLSAFRLSIPGAQMPTVLAAWGAQSFGFLLFAFVNAGVATLILPGSVPFPVSGHRLVQLLGQHRIVAVLAALILIGSVVLLLAVCRLRLIRLKDQVVAGVSIFESPWHYARAILLPVFISCGCRYGMALVAMSAFGIPITPSTVALALVSHEIAGMIRFTPGGFGTTQVVDLVALHALASSATIAAYSFTQGTMMTAMTLLSGGIAIIWSAKSRSDEQTRGVLARARLPR